MEVEPVATVAERAEICDNGENWFRDSGHRISMANARPEIATAAQCTTKAKSIKAECGKKGQKVKSNR